MRQRTLKPHDGLYVRLGPSTIHGVGVFAIKAIPKGCYVFEHDACGLAEVPFRMVARLPKAVAKMYNDFCVRRGETLVCPRFFNTMTIAWYLNHSDRPNMGADEDLEFFALRRIRAGEELVVNYGRFSEGPLHFD